jgi:hypothetical protein
MATTLKCLLALALICMTSCSRVSYWVLENKSAEPIKISSARGRFELLPGETLEIRALEYVFESKGQQWIYKWREIPVEYIETKLDGARIYWSVDDNKRLNLLKPARDGGAPAGGQPSGFPLVAIPLAPPQTPPPR